MTISIDQNNNNNYHDGQGIHSQLPLLHVLILINSTDPN